jgi:thiol-disulfide isomerase/thioredoxin
LRRSAPWFNRVSRFSQCLLGIAVAAFAAWAGYVLQLSSRNDTARADAVSRLLTTTLPDPAGTKHAIAQWRGRVLVVNFWATWCEPCREEIPGLMRLRKKHASNGVEFIGIAVDSASKVLDYTKIIQIDYPLLIGGVESIELARLLGDGAGGLPFTIVLDRSGKVAKSHLGLVREEELDQKLSELAR